ncbi:RNA-binding domain-containing protein [Gloeophyllum trabeum ATCC 11539]|uniref:RNA-binding domain-containing protein n=1 Tax=Gloeophyllum trabeum (strain ATCC 11539 / FP-39264 / Madison 617) TaxID=670483 RepID=S7QJ56_GLOTA|nr:RNA-binding domain-containing protein [Gloeophyllum trabeum ATCC 11539]EPQ59696.1 RNA-binding domain-containing protein [Gloeophyllum trabeum ATCC 11539]
MQYAENTPAVDPYSDAYNAPPPAAIPAGGDRDAPRGRSRSRSRSPGYRSPTYRSSRRSPVPAPKRPSHAPIAPNPSNVLGVFGLSIRTTERDLEDEFNRFGRVEKVVIVYDQRSDRSRGFGFITMSTVEEATRCIKELNGVDLNGRRIRVDYSVTDRPHAPTPGEYMGHRRRRDNRDSYYGGRERDRDYRDSYRDRDSRRHDRDRDYDRDRDPRDREYDRDHYGRDRDWRDRRSPPPVREGGRRYSPDYRRRRSYSRSPPRGSSPSKGRDYDAGGSSAANGAGADPRW